MRSSATAPGGLAAALRAEVAGYVDAHRDQVDEAGHRLVVRNGHHAEQEVTTAAGAVPVRAPRVNDRRSDETTGKAERAGCSQLQADAELEAVIATPAAPPRRPPGGRRVVPERA